MIIAKNIHKYYGDVEVLKGVNLTIKKGEIVAIVGPSGAGKTTLLQILGTLDKPLKEEDYILEINGITLQGLSDKMIASFRNEHVGYIFQFHQLLPEFTAIENICIPAYIGNTPKIVAEKKAKELLSFLNLSNRVNHKPNELSGGEQQRVAVARALINNPSIILADEPSGNLDTESAENLHNLFFKLRDEFGQTFVIVTHNNELANMVDRKLTMKDGKIIEANASKGEEVLQKVLKSDEGASRIGEVALVPHSSPISQSGIIFYNTLFDENAASHIALGQCYSKCFKGELDLSKKEISKRGGNSSMIHIDWMIGSDQINVDGIDQSGNSIPIFRKGEWVS